MTVRVVCLLGPTASGKTAAALALAMRRPIEIISIDSALVYRGMDIGTAKPTHAELASVPHHLIDIIEPNDAYSAAQFHDDALRLIAQILERGREPVLVGGTMLYYKALTEGLNDLPSADPALRAQLDEEGLRDGWPAMHARLAEVDPITAARLPPNDSQRIQRALEIFLVSRRPMSAWLAEPRRTHDTGYQFVPISLEPSNRAVLHERIATRFDAMLDHGLIDEVERLRARGDLDLSMSSMRCVGYRQVWEYLDGVTDRATMRDKGVFATRQLCKRQITWLRSIPDRLIVDCASDGTTQRVLDAIARSGTLAGSSD